LLAQSTDTDVLNMPDNIALAPWSDLFLCEDSVAGPQHLRVLGSDGRVSDFGRNAVSRSELAGVCFSPDGRTLFVNIYGDALTLAVRGPFPHA
jgi:secreted PhoX family phosphatase